MKRYLEPAIRQDLDKKMVFIGGPRQVGKTTLAKNIAQSYANPTYLNWDSRDDKKAILASIFAGGTALVIYDEIHKYRDWKNHLKGVYDTRKNEFALLVTGSARLDLYQKGGDSLLGRYFYYRLHPLSIAELLDKPYDRDAGRVFAEHIPAAPWQDLITFGGFPEVFLAKDVRDLKRWHHDREKRLIQEDIRDVSNIRDLSTLEILAMLLPGRVGSLFSLNALVEDLKVTHKTIAHWMDTLEQMYFCYRIYPYQNTRIKSLRKEPKIYLWDYTGIGAVDDLGARHENIVANHLLKYTHYLTDVYGIPATLYFLRDKEQREVDFCVVADSEIEFIVEVKTKKSAISPHLRYFKEKLNIRHAYQLVFSDAVDEDHNGIRMMSADKFLSGLV
ncbi:MAG: ATP-binding protein [Pseudomonadota bacterium]|nr:ATP-binding protein [Pseudomonadota bacterium]